MKHAKITLLTLSIALILNLVNAATISASPHSHDPYEEGLRVYQQQLKEEQRLSDTSKDAKVLREENYQKSQQSNYSTNSSEPAVIGSLVKILFKQLIKKSDDAIVHATKNNIKTKIKKHFMEQAVARGITEVMVDNILGEVSTGIYKVLKFDDVLGNSRIMYDPNSKLTVVISKFENTLITTYIDEDDTKDKRVKAGRWIPSIWNYK